jgi:hemoglobin/transferrin/lactoferrin receptor protein
MKSEKLILNDGIRLQSVNLRSIIDDNSFFNLPVTSIEQTTFAATGNLGLVYLPTEDFRLSTGLSSGFRHPNIDDLARVFESSTALKRVVIPNPDIKPEYTYNLDLGVTHWIGAYPVKWPGFNSI